MAFKTDVHLQEAQNDSLAPFASGKHRAEFLMVQTYRSVYLTPHFLPCLPPVVVWFVCVCAHVCMEAKG